MAHWFESLTGFKETDYKTTQARLRVQDGRLHSDESERAARVGRLDLASLDELRAQTRGIKGGGRLRLSIVQGDVRAMHAKPENEGALFQVASQFNLLEMTGPEVTPEQGVSRYEWDRTQGPACAMACGAGTIWRNYFAPVDGQEGQTANRQIDALADLGEALSTRLGLRPGGLWRMSNGYAFPTGRSLGMVAQMLRDLDEEGRDRLRGLLRIGLHWDVEVTDVPGPICFLVSQAYCSALPVGYSDLPRSAWAPLASLVQEASYETVLRAAVLNAARGASRRLLLTRIGGGVFGNEEAWIDAAILRALRLVRDHELDVVMVNYGAPSVAMTGLLSAWEKE